MLATAALVALAPLAFLDDRADLDLLDPELRRWLPYLLGIAFLGFLDDALGQGTEGRVPRGWRGHGRALREGSLSTGAIKAGGRWRWPHTSSPDRGSNPGATSPTWRS